MHLNDHDMWAFVKKLTRKGSWEILCFYSYHIVVISTLFNSSIIWLYTYDERKTKLKKNHVVDTTTNWYKPNCYFIFLFTLFQKLPLHPESLQKIKNTQTKTALPAHSRWIWNFEDIWTPRLRGAAIKPGLEHWTCSSTNIKNIWCHLMLSNLEQEASRLQEANLFEYLRYWECMQLLNILLCPVW